MCIRDSLIGGEAPPAAETLPATADLLPLFSGAGIDDFALCIGTKRTFHIALSLSAPVSYTHLDVYKRQELDTFNLEHADMEKVAALREQFGYAADDFVTVFVGRVGKEKNIDQLLDLSLIHISPPRSPCCP